MWFILIFCLLFLANCVLHTYSRVKLVYVIKKLMVFINNTLRLNIGREKKKIVKHLNVLN